MPRPCKRRRICALPGCGRFGPMEHDAAEYPAVQRPAITMGVDEFESIRLIDLEGMTQEECAAQMGVARTTAQAIYNSARVKLAQCLVYGKALTIEGGHYVLCEGGGCGRACGRCSRGENGNTENNHENREEEKHEDRDTL